MKINPDRNLDFPQSQEPLVDQPQLDLPIEKHEDILSAIKSSAAQLGPIGSSSIVSANGTTPINLSQTFALNSLAGANHTIYLDFDGHTTTGTQWNTQHNGGQDITTPSYDIDNDTTSFSDIEKANIQAIWQRVAEDFSPFNINVTTQMPTDINDLKKIDEDDKRWGVRVVIGGSSSAWSNGGASGGLAYLTSFNSNTDTPAFVFAENDFEGKEKSIAEIISHEVGHTLGLEHDGQITPDLAIDDIDYYYAGHGSGETGWATIMGEGYNQKLSQWSKGEYNLANEKQDDLDIITTENGFSYRTDDAGDNISAAKALTISGDSVSGNGIIEKNTDVDYHTFEANAGAIDLTINAASRGANLDILAELYSADGTRIASSNPIDKLSANISTTLATAGSYYLKIDGVGAGDPLRVGYSDYGSLGQYFISGTVTPITVTPITLQGVSVALAPASVMEDGTANLVYTFSRTGDLTSALTIKYSVGGTATTDDYTSSSAGTITFAANSKTATLTITPTADLKVEGDETVSLTLVNDPTYTVLTSTAIIGTIKNDDSIPAITLALAPASVMEDGTADLVYTFSRTGDLTSALTVKYSVGGTATTDDYTSSSVETITFAANSNTATLTINPTADLKVEGDETVAVMLVNDPTYTILTSTAIIGTITNDDIPITGDIKSFVLDLSRIDKPISTVTFSVGREAQYNNSVGFYKTLDAEGSIQAGDIILKPSDAGYIQAALQGAVVNAEKSEVNLSVNNYGNKDITVELGKSFYMPIIVSDGTLTAAANGQKLNAYTAFAVANADKIEHIRQVGNNTFGFEDTFGGGDRDYNDLIIKATIA